MQIDSPDPAFTLSERARANFRLAARLALGFVALLWVIPLLGWGLELERFGVNPRHWSGLPGILVAPVLHASFIHLIANSLPVLVLGTTMLHLYPTAAFRVLPAIYLGPGIAVWLFGRDGIHVGASGLVYGLFGYVFVAGLIRRDRRAIAASLLVAFMYGTMAWGVLPIRQGCLLGNPSGGGTDRRGVGNRAAAHRHAATHPVRLGKRNEDHIDDPPSADGDARADR